MGYRNPQIDDKRGYCTHGVVLVPESVRAVLAEVDLVLEVRLDVLQILNFFERF